MGPLLYHVAMAMLFGARQVRICQKIKHARQQPKDGKYSRDLDALETGGRLVQDNRW